MFGPRFFGPRYFGARYFGPLGVLYTIASRNGVSWSLISTIHTVDRANIADLNTVSTS